MFVGFIGAPNSGKTTIAAKVFAELKQSGQSDVEFIAEEARRYIAKWKASDPAHKLDNLDQSMIFSAQSHAEKLMVGAVGEYGIVVSDSCALNSLWYMTPDYRQQVIARELDYFNWLKTNALLFYASPVGIPTSTDSLRLHNAKESLWIDNTIVAAIKEWNGLPALAPFNIKALHGSMDIRTTKVVEQIYERLMAH